MDLGLLIVLLLGLLDHRVFSKETELTFELPDNDKMCFHEKIDKNVRSTLSYQVVGGGNYDVDLEITAPNGQYLYQEAKQQDGTFTWVPSATGAYTFCFSNEFSTFTHKIVYFHLQVGEDRALEEVLQVNEEEDAAHTAAMTLMESSSENIHKFLSLASSSQSFFRNRETGGRQFAEDLNHRVVLWSLGETMAVLVVGLGQVLVLRSFFARPSPHTSTTNGCIST
ncbi:hypothetical protein ACOMHN_057689 [Nucella lapillus]